MGANNFPIISNVCASLTCIVNHFINKLLLPQQSCIFESSYVEGSQCSPQENHNSTPFPQHSMTDAILVIYSLVSNRDRAVTGAHKGMSRSVEKSSWKLRRGKLISGDAIRIIFAMCWFINSKIWCVVEGLLVRKATLQNGRAKAYFYDRIESLQRSVGAVSWKL